MAVSSALMLFGAGITGSACACANTVSIATTDGRLFVQRVGDNSRAARIGLQSGDVIVKVDGKEVASVGELRKLVSAKEKGLVVDVTRAGDELKLTEKEK